MKKFNLIILFFTICVRIYPQSSSQSLQIICPDGDFYVGKSATISWTLGEPVIETFKSKNNKYHLTQGFEQPDVSSKTHVLDGYVTYNNILNTPLTNSWVFLVNSEFKTIDSNQTDNAGHFIFKNVIDGAYTLRCKTTKTWGKSAVNPIDALKVNRNYIGLYFLTDLKKIAGNVAMPINGDPTPNDAFLINRRYIRLISKFDIPDWVFQKIDVNISDANVTQNILSLCAGDVNASYNPPLKTTDNMAGYRNEGIVLVNNMEEFELPVTAIHNLTIGALGLVIKYPSDLITVKGVQSKFPGLIFNILNNEVRIALTDNSNNGFVVNANDTIINLKFITNNLKLKDEISLSLDEESIIADIHTQIIRGEELNIPRIVMQQTLNSGYYISQNYPNPFTSFTSIDYYLPEPANISLKLYDIMGKEVRELINGNESSGYHNIKFASEGLSTGLYMYTYNALGTNSKFNKNRILIINK